MRHEIETDPSERYLLCSAAFSDDSLLTLKSEVQKFMAAREKNRTYQRYIHWTRSKLEGLALHTAGATVQHSHPFENLEVPRNNTELTREFADQWVNPYYMYLLSYPGEDVLPSFASAAKLFDEQIVVELLGYFNWRARITGAYFASIKRYANLEDVIGRHLLKSEVCYAGAGYCLALASFGTENSKNYLIQYLEYYYQRKDLWFDQDQAFCALEYLDKSAAYTLLDKRQEFVSDKPNWDLEHSRSSFQASIETLDRIREMVKGKTI